MIVQGDPVGEWVCSRTKEQWFSQGAVAIGQQEEGILTAGVIFDRYNKACITSTLAADKRLSRKFVRAILSYAFDVAKVNCVVNVVSSANHKSIKLTEHFGFKRVAEIPHAMPDGDMVIFSLSRDDCKKFMR